MTRTDATLSPAGVAAVDWRRLHAFGLPGGSVRAMLAVLIFAAIWVWLWLRPEQEVPAYLQNLMFIIMGHYFAARARAGATSGPAADGAPDPGPPPLYLPKGTVRFVLVGGFIAVAAGLIYRHRVWEVAPAGGSSFRLNHGGVTLILVAGFLLGVVLGRFRQWRASAGRRMPRIVEDLRAAVSLAAALLLLLMVFGLYSPPPQGFLAGAQQFFVKYRAEDVLAAVVGFYFGSRS